MIPYLLCAVAFLGTLAAARRSLGAGMVAATAVGYAYGIVRANLLSPATHLLFDCAVVGLYIGAAPTIIDRISNDARLRPLAGWAIALMGWPLVLFFVPGYDPLVQVVGLRGNAFLLPFLLVGASLQESDIRKLAVWLSVLNLAALALAILEFSTDVRLFFPMNAVTRIIYASNDVAGFTAFRIPSSFVNAHAYAGTMVVTLPVLIAAFSGPRESWWRSLLSYGGIGAALVGVFMAATRVHAGVLLALIAVVTFAGGMSRRAVVGWLAALCLVAGLVQSDVRFQRFASLGDSDVIRTRFGWSVNSGVIDVISGYPLGNGLAGGGTSVPYFLEAAEAKTLVENEYGRIAVEQGTIGLVLWIGFIIWFLTRAPLSRSAPWFLGRIASWAAVSAYWVTSLLGTGTLTSIPHTSLMLLLAGWVAVPARVEPVRVVARGEALPLRPGWQTRRDDSRGFAR